MSLRIVLFHENVHAILHSWYGEGSRDIAERFWDEAPDEGGKVSKQFIKDYYDDEEWNDEVFVTWLGNALADGSVNDKLQHMTDPADIQRVDKILKTLGYDRAKEETTSGQAPAEEVDEESADGRAAGGQKGVGAEFESDASFPARLAEA